MFSCLSSGWIRPSPAHLPPHPPPAWIWIQTNIINILHCIKIKDTHGSTGIMKHTRTYTKTSHVKAKNNRDMHLLEVIIFSIEKSLCEKQNKQNKIENQ